MLLLAALISLNGVWVRPCQQNNIQIQFFETQKNYTDEIFFEDQNCQKPLMSFSNEGVYTLKPNHIDYQFESVAITIYSKPMLDDFNKRRVCGFTNWQMNSPKMVTGLKCGLFTSREIQIPKKGEPRFGIWQLREGKLYFGKLTPSHPALTPETRPIEWDERPYFKQL
ncbi:MAG: hypothetical protein ACK5W9_08045 [Bdellovibrionales bacterium]